MMTTEVDCIPSKFMRQIFGLAAVLLVGRHTKIMNMRNFSEHMLISYGLLVVRHHWPGC